MYQLQLPDQRTLSAEDVTIRENGAPPSGQIAVEAPNSTSGVILLIDASLSMKGEPIEQAMAAARAFMQVRPEEMPVAVVAYNPEQHELTGFTTDSAVLNEAVATTPEVVLGTEIYDSLILASEMATDQGLKRATVVLLSDGNENLSEAGAADALAALEAANMRVIAVGFQSIRYNPARLNGSRREPAGRSFRQRRRPSSFPPSSRSASASRTSTSSRTGRCSQRTRRWR